MNKYPTFSFQDILRFFGFIVFFLGANGLSAQYTLNGTATSLSGGCVRLTSASNTQNGSMWSQSTLNLNQDFDLTFELFLGSNNGGADGMTFVLSPNSSNTGIGGGGIGYLGITNSLAVEFDTWQNGNYGDPTFDHVALISNGITDHATANTLVAPVQASPTNINIEDNQEHTFRIKWFSATNTLEVYFDCSLRFSYTGNIIANQLNNNSTVHYGFTASTGGASNVHRVCPPPIPEGTATDILLCLGDTVSVQAPSSVTGASYTWSAAAGINSSGQNADLYPFQNTTYNVTVDHPCSTLVDTFYVDVTTQFNSNFTFPDSLCEGTPSLIGVPVVPGGIWSGSGITDSIAGEFTPDTAGIGTHQITYTIGGNCGADTTIPITIVALPNTTFTVPDKLCIADTLDLSPSQNGGIWSGQGILDTLNGRFNYNGLTPGTYFMYYTISSPCLSRDTGQVEVISRFNPSTTQAIGICANDTVALTASPNTTGIPGVDYTAYWSGTGVYDSSGLVSGPLLGIGGPYTLYYTVSMPDGGCPGVDSTLVTVYQTAPSGFTGGTFCSDNEERQNVGVQFNGGDWSIVSPTGGDTTFNPLNYKPVDLGAGQWILTYTISDSITANGCGSSHIDTITIYETPETPEINGGSYCEGEEITFSTNASADTLLWFSDQGGNDFITYGTELTFNDTALSPPDYTVYIQAINGICKSAIGNGNALIFPNPNASILPNGDTVIIPATIQFTGSAGLDGENSYNWLVDGNLDSGDSLFSIDVNEYTVPFIEARLVTTTEGGCADTAYSIIYLDVIPSEVNIPNVFSPNGDGCNDFFGAYSSSCNGEGEITFLEGFRSYECTIYNRWGTKIFSFSEGGNWDGGDSTEGTYFYTIEAVTFSGELQAFQGGITLLR